VADVSDGEFLLRFVNQWDQVAFRDLVGRHGPMVLGVCRRIPRDSHAAEDAFQATSSRGQFERTGDTACVSL
jgi:hypothetical protein